MAGLRRMRRRYRGIPVVVVLLAALAFGLTSSSADTADPATAPIANDVSSGLQSFAQSLTGLDSLNQLGQSLPFTSQVPTAANGLNYAQTFTDSLKAKLAAHPAFTSLTELEAYLSTGISDTYGGVAVTANATVSPQTAGAPLYTIGLALHLSRTGTTPLKLDTSQVNVDGGSLTTSFDATANLSFKYDPAQAAGNKFYLDAASAPLLQTTASAQANFTASPFDINLGFTSVHVGGDANVGATIKAQLQDPDGNGKISQTEWSTTAPQQEFDVSFTASHADANINLSSDIAKPLGGSLASATITEHDTNLTNGLDTPNVSLGDLGGFKNIQPQDFMSALASLAVLIQTFEQSGPAAIDLPFLHRDPSAPSTDTPVENLADVLKLNAGLIKFFEDNGFSDPSNPLSLNLDPAHLATVSNVQDVLAKVTAALGASAPGLGLAYDPTSKHLTFTLGQSRHDLTPVSAHVNMGDQLKGVGLTSVDTVGAQATVDPSFDWHLKLGVDLNPPGAGTTLSDRIFLVPSATEFSADAKISGTLDMVGQIGFLGLSLKSIQGGVPGSVRILDRADASKPMIQLKLKPNADDKLTLKQIFDGFGSDSTPADPFSVLDASSASDIVNAAVPAFDLKAAASLNNGAQLVQGVAHVQWDNILTGTPQLSADGDFSSQLLAFDFDPSNPAAMFTQLMDILGPITQQIEAQVQSNPSLQEKLPVINKSFADLVDAFTKLSSTINDFASSPSAFLQTFENDLEDRIAAAFGIPAADKENLVSIMLTPGSGSTPPTVNFRLSFGLCTAPTGAPADPECTISTPLHVPLSLSLPDIGGLVSVTGTGGVDISTKAVVKIGFGIHLPTVSPALGSGDPIVSGSPELFIDTDPAKTALNVDLHAQTDENTSLQASVGPITMTLGKTYTAESGADCDNATDDNGNGAINDGCPQVGATAETALSGQCDNATDDDAADADGKINDGCPVVNKPIVAKVGAKFHLSHDSGEVVIDPSNLTPLTDWIGDLIPSSIDDFRPDVHAECPAYPSTAGSGPFDACATVPVFLHAADASPTGNITFAAENIFDPSTWDGEVDPSIVTAILGQPLDWTTIVHGLHTVTHNLQDALDASAYGGADLPVIGHSLDAGAQIVEKLNTNFVDPLNDLATSLEGVATFDGVADLIRNTIWDHLGQPGANLVLPYDADAPDGTVPAASDIKVTFRCGSDLHICDATSGDTVGAIMNAEISLGIGGSIADAKFKFDSGFPGLRLTMDKEIKAGVDFRYDLTFGLSRSRGFYVRTDEPADTHRDKELTVNAHVHLPNDGTHGDLAFLRIDVSNNNTADDYADLGLELAADVKGGQTDADGATKLAFSDLTASDPSNPADLAVTLEGGIHLNLKLVLSVHMPESIGDLPGEGALPKLNSDFHVDWGFGAGISLNDGLSGHVDDLAIKFDNVQLDLGSFFAEFLLPIVHDVQKFTKPLQPIIDTATAPIPGLSQLSELAGNGKLTFMDFFEQASGADLTMVRRLIDLITLINNFPESGSVIDLGHFSLDSSAVTGAAPTGDNADRLIDTSDESPSLNAFNAPGASFSHADTLSHAQAEGGLTFPAFTDTRNLFNLLVGKDVKLIEFDAGDLKASFGFDISIGPFPAGPVPVSIIIGGSAGIEGHFAIGYSTRGIREAVKGLTDDDTSNDGFFQNASLLFDGIFIDDLNAEGVDVPEIRLTAEVHAGAEVSIVIASAGVLVGIKATVDMNLHDGGRPTDPAKVDGLLYMDELASMLNNPICIFDVSGQLDAFVKFFITVGFSPFDFSFDITIVEVTLLNMQDITDPICNHPPPPHLAQEDDASGTLILKIGPNTPGRNVADGAGGRELQDSEKVVVRQLDNNPGDGHKFSVTAFGLTQEYPEEGHPLIKRIFADGGTKKDNITMQPGVVSTNGAAGAIDSTPIDVSVPVEICGGADKDVIQGGTANDILVGDGPDAAPGAIHCPTPTVENATTDGPDSIGGNAGDDTIDGGGAGDTLVGEAGNDTINSGSGDDNSQGGEGVDTIHGDAGNDSLSGGPEVDGPNTGDTIFGDDGNDSISGDNGADHLFGGNDNDSLAGANGADDMHGQAGDDTLTGGKGDDQGDGGPGADKIFGEAGSDTLKGGPDNDVIVGSDDNTGTTGVGDDIAGGPGNDLIFGDQAVPSGGTFVESGTFVGNDLINGDDGNDVVWGQDGTDTINGGADADELHGESGPDVMNGNAGIDTMFGDNGNDLMHGNEDADTMRGGIGVDTMFGDTGDDTMFGDAGDDVMHGNEDVDHMRGGTENDLMNGDAGNDVMNGDAGLDKMYGDAGDDSMHGDAQDDYMEGNAGSDSMTGDANQDDIIGGSNSAGQLDAGDTICGGDCITPALTDDHDVIAGDNATITRPGGDRVDGAHKRSVTLFDLSSGDSSLYGGDTVSGDQGNDVIYGENGADTLHGNADDDLIEGNSGGDAVFGDQGQDDLIGGTSQGGGGVPDGNDCIQGDDRTNNCLGSGSGGGAAAGGTAGGTASSDVMIGDNGSITRTPNAAGTDWIRDDFGGGTAGTVRRTVTMFDLATTTSSPPAGTFGNDVLYGDDGRDIQYGQSGNDTIHGGNGDDYAEGNADSDAIFGDASSDDLIGGSAVALRLDAGDTISGGTGPDVAAGDNAVISRPSDAGGLWIHDNRSHSASDIVRRAVTLLEVATTTVTPPAGTGAADTINGDDGADQLFGQAGDDTVNGGADDDYVEGNVGADTINGNTGRDDLVGGGSANDGVISATSVGNNLIDGADTMHGNESGDVVSGDNARIARQPAAPAASAATPWVTDPNTDVDAAGDRDPVRSVQVFDLDKVGSATPSAATSGGDGLFGDDGRDIMVGQGGNDTMSGGEGVDYMAGAAGADTMSGDGGEDDMIGGSSAGNGLITDVLPAVQRGTYSSPRDLRDGNDTMTGNLEDDVMVGDNASVARPERVSGSGLWWRLTNANFDLARRIVTMEKTPEAAGAYGNDTMSGGEATDDLYGQLGDDNMSGNEGEDAMVGDLGLITNNLIDAGADGLTDPGTQHLIAPSSPFFDPGETIFPTASLYRQVELYAFDSLKAGVAAGDDTMAGGDGHDSIHGGPGADVLSGNGGDDYIFGDDSTLVTFSYTTYSPVGSDAMWGGPGHDTMFGGRGVDFLDVLPRDAETVKKVSFPADPPSWFAAASVDPVQPDGHAGAYSGSDIMYGGFDRDWMQLDVSGAGPPIGDRALDWMGGFNAYYRCDSTYGDWGITRQFSPSMQAFLQELAFGMGAIQTTTAGTSGFDETAMVFAGDPGNANPVNPDNPAHFTCGVPHS